MPAHKKYFTEEERKAARKETLKRYNQSEKRKATQKRYEENNNEKVLESKKQYNQSEKGKASQKRYEESHPDIKNEYYNSLEGKAVSKLNKYRQMDRKYTNGGTTLTSVWIIENIFSGQKCIYCGESDWTKLGCDRIDNSKPHTPENVVCSCGKCNNERRCKRMSMTEFMEYKKGAS